MAKIHAEPPSWVWQVGGQSPSWCPSTRRARSFYEVIAASLPREAVPTADRRQPDPFARPHGFLHVVLSPVVCWGRSHPLRLGETAFFSVDFRASPGQPDLSCVLARGRPRPSGRCGHHASISATG